MSRGFRAFREIVGGLVDALLMELLISMLPELAAAGRRSHQRCDGVSGGAYSLDDTRQVPGLSQAAAYGRRFRTYVREDQQETRRARAAKGSTT